LKSRERRFTRDKVVCIARVRYLEQAMTKADKRPSFIRFFKSAQQNIKEGNPVEGRANITLSRTYFRCEGRSRGSLFRKGVVAMTSEAFFRIGGADHRRSLLI
jgi:hypothetical protein